MKYEPTFFIYTYIIIMNISKNNKKFMLITTEVKIFKNYIPIGEVSKHSHKKVKVKCDSCGKVKEIKYNSYNVSTNNGNGDYYCNNKECINKKRTIVIQEKYGVDNVSQLNDVKKKKVETSLKNYGVEYPIQSDEIKEKIKNINNKNFGKDWITQTDIFKEKSKITNLERYGTESASQSEIIKNKLKKTCLEKYDVDSYMKTDEFKESSIETNINRYGVKYPSQSEEIKKKIKDTNIEKYGFERPTQAQEIKDKIKQSFIDRFGVDNPNKLQEIRDKIKNTNIVKYNTEFYSQSELYQDIVKKRKMILLSDRYNLSIKDIKDNIIISKCDNCNENFEANYQLLYNRYVYNTTLCTKCNPINSLSDCEIQLQKIIKENYNDEVLLNDRNIIKPYELDIYIPELKLAFEFNGLYWHSELYKDNNYHLKKTELCEKLGIQLIHIFQDDLEFKNDIVRSIILNKLNKTSNKIYARNCEIKEINDVKLIRKFLTENHMQGYVNSEIKIGLFYENDLISIMTFGRKRKIMNSVSNNNEYEMYRFCNKLNTNIIGGINRLFSYFIKKYNFYTIVSYVDRSYFNGNNYLKLGFKLDGKTQPNYHYIVGRKREYRFNYRKDILVKEGYDINKTEHEIMLERGIYRIYNSGNYKMIYEK